VCTHGDKFLSCSTGILAYQLLTGRLPFIGDNGVLVSKLYMTKQIFSNKDVFRAILYADLDFTSKPWDEISTEAKDLVQQLLTRNPSRRPTAAEALIHPWFQARCPIIFALAIS
jgi:serine/threonine protein kinase